MSQPTTDTDTDTETSSELELMAEPARLKIFQVDAPVALAIQKDGQKVIRTLTLHEILREAVHAGLPIVARKYAAMANVAKTTK